MVREVSRAAVDRDSRGSTSPPADGCATRCNARVWVSAEVKHYAWQTAPAASYVDRFTVSISDAYMELLLLFFAPPPIGKRSIVMSVSVCLCVFVCPRSHLRNYTSDLHRIFLCVLPMAATRSSPGGVVIRYVLPVLWMTSILLISQGCSTSPPS